MKKDIVAGVTVLTLESGGPSFLMLAPPFNAGLLSIMAIDNCLVNGMLAANTNNSKIKLDYNFMKQNIIDKYSIFLLH